MRIRIRIGPSTGENVTHYKSWVAAIIYLTVIKSFSLLLIRPRGRKLMSKNIILIICPMIGMISPTSSSTSIACFISIWILGYDRDTHIKLLFLVGPAVGLSLLLLCQKKKWVRFSEECIN